MSVFKVKLNNNKQGRLDLDPTTNTSNTYGNVGTSFPVSLQRSMFVAGPKMRYRKLVDGQTFTDSNYWKRFTSEVMGEEFAFIEVVTDDGSVYSDVESENTVAIGATLTLSTSFADTVVNFVTTHGGPAKFLSVQNLHATIAVTGELNGNTNITFAVAAGETMMFNQGDLVITSLRLKGASGTPSVSYIASVASTSNS